MSLQLDPEFAAAMAPMAEVFASAPKLAAGDVVGRRAVTEKFGSAMNASLPDIPHVKRHDHMVKMSDGTGILVAEFRPDDTPRPSKAIYHIHGGAMISGSVDLFDKRLKSVAAGFGVPVFAVDYRLAPEHPHPIPVTDCFTGLRWLSENSKDLGVDSTKIIVHGESAGGGLAAGTCLLARDQNLQPPVAKQILIYPMLDDRNVEPIPGIEEHALCKADDSKTGWQALLGDRAGSSEVSEYAAPARARSVVGLPATYIMCGQLDIFIEESTKFALKLVQAQVPVEYHIYPGVPHAFESMAPHISYARAEAAAVAHAVAAV